MTKMMMTPLPPADISIPSLPSPSPESEVLSPIHLVAVGAAAGRVAKIDHAVDDISLAGKRKMSERVGGRPASEEGTTNRVTNQQPFLAKYTYLQFHKCPAFFRNPLAMLIFATRMEGASTHWRERGPLFCRPEGVGWT